MNNFTSIHPTAKIASSAKIWNFTTIESEVKIEDDVVIGSNCFIGRGTVIHSGTRIQHGVFIPRNSMIGSKVFIGPNTCFTDDPLPVAGNFAYDPRLVQVFDEASIGAGCVILPGVIIGKKAMVGAGSIITKDVPSHSTVYCEQSLKIRSAI